MSEEYVNMTVPTQAVGLEPKAQDQLRRLYEVWTNKLARNQLRKKYYRGKNTLTDLGIAIPPQLKKTEMVLGWAAKSVDMLASRSIFDGFVYKDSETGGIEDILRQNNFNMMYRQAVKSELIHSCAFITVSKGGEGEPEVIVSSYSAEFAAAIWDMRRKRIECGFTVVDIDKDTKMPTWINLYNDEAVYEIRRNGSAWVANKVPHSQGRPLMEPLVYSPELDRPMGKSRISRAVMSIVDSGVRASLRAEISAEFFTTPQRYLLGADEKIFKDKSKWEAYIGNIFAITPNQETGESPQYGQLAQMSMQPHVDYLRSLAAQFAGETGIPISSLGVVHDNPASAEAIYAAREDLIVEAESLNVTNGVALRNIGLLIHAIKNNTTIDELSEAEKSITPRFKNPSTPSVVSQSDAIVKQCSVLPYLAETEVALEELGYNESQRMRILAAKRRIDAKTTLQELSAMPDQQEGQKKTMYMEQSIIKSFRSGTISRKDAVRLFGQLGIDEGEVADILADEEPTGAGEA